MRNLASWLNEIELEGTGVRRSLSILAPLFSVLIAFGAVSLLMLFSGVAFPSDTVSLIVEALFSEANLKESLVMIVPVALTSLGVSVALKAGFWNIGGEGQLLLGALGGFLVTITIPTQHGSLGLLAGCFAAFICGGCVCVAIAFAKTNRGADEVFLTLMSNFAAVYFVGYLVSGPLRDPITNWIQSIPLPGSMRFSRIPGWGRVNTSLFVMALCSSVLIFAEKRSYWNIVFNVTKNSSYAIQIHDLNPNSIIVLAAFISGGLCGLAGWAELAGTQYRLIENLSPGYGYFAVLTAVLANGRITQTILYSVMMSVILNGIDSFTHQAHIPTYIGDVLLGICLVSYIVLFKFSRNSIRLRSKGTKLVEWNS